MNAVEGIGRIAKLIGVIGIICAVAGLIGFIYMLVQSGYSNDAIGLLIGGLVVAIAFKVIEWIIKGFLVPKKN